MLFRACIIFRGLQDALFKNAQNISDNVVLYIKTLHFQYMEEAVMETILCIDTPVQMISCTDTNGKITPMWFHFRDRNGELVTIHIDRVISTDQKQGSLIWRALAVNMLCFLYVWFLLR